MPAEPSADPAQTNLTETDRSWRLEELPWPEIGRALARDPRLILPVGALAQHGPHLPLGANTLIAERVALEVSRRCRVLLAPALRYGVNRSSTETFAGCAGLQRKTLHRTLNELFADWEDHGVQEFLILTAYQHEPHLDALLMTITARARTHVVNLFSIDVSDILDGPPLLEHAGELETSLLLHLAPGLVREDQMMDVPADPEALRRYAHGRIPTPPPGSRGVLGYPTRATASKGAAVFSRYVESLEEVLLNHRSPSPRRR